MRFTLLCSVAPWALLLIASLADAVPAGKEGAPKKPNPSVTAALIAEGTRKCNEADGLVIQGKLNEALPLYEEVLKTLPESPRAREGVRHCRSHLATGYQAAPQQRRTRSTCIVLSPWQPLQSNVRPGTHVYAGFGEKKTYVFQILAVNERHPDPLLDRTFAALIVMYPDGEVEVKDRRAMVAKRYLFVKPDGR